MSWQNLAKDYGLPQRYNSKKLDQYHASTCCLPLSFHAELFKASWRAADVYMDKIYQTEETTGFHVLKPLMLSLLALFHGRLVDNPRHRMAHDKKIPAGDITHEVFAMGSTIFIILEVVLLAPQEEENVALLFKQLIAAARDNQQSGLQVRVYGLLTDRTRFAFFSYDHSRRCFSFDEELVADGPREQFLARLIPVANKIFSVLFAGFFAVLQAPVAPKATGECSNTRVAIQYAAEATRRFASGTSEKANDLNIGSVEALRLLQASVLAVPRGIDAYMDVQEPKSAEELEDLALRSVREWHERRCPTSLVE